MKFYYLNELLKQKTELQAQRENIAEAIDAITGCYKSGGKLLVCGNGGSSADADHITGELLKGFLKKRPVCEDFTRKLYDAAPDLQTDNTALRLQEGLPAVSLSNQNAVMTASANDLGGDLMFAQQVMAMGKPGDVFVGISTSGNADNVYKAAAVAKAKGMRVIALTGEGGGRLRRLADICVMAPNNSTPVIQEYHLCIYHAICADVEAALFAE